MNVSWCYRWDHGSEWEGPGQLLFSLRQSSIAHQWQLRKVSVTWVTRFCSLILSGVPVWMTEHMAMLPPACRWASLLCQPSPHQDHSFPFIDPLAVPWDVQQWSGHSKSSLPKETIMKEQTEHHGTIRHHIRSLPFFPLQWMISFIFLWTCRKKGRVKERKQTIKPRTH